MLSLPYTRPVDIDVASLCLSGFSWAATLCCAAATAAASAFTVWTSTVPCCYVAQPSLTRGRSAPRLLQRCFGLS